jgi:hypothetical protein
MKDMKEMSGLGGIVVAARACLSIAPHGVALLCAMSFVGCLAQTGDETDGEVGVTQEAAITHNALTHNALTHNALTHNALTHNALTASALTSDTATNAALSDPDSREVLEYIASCALPPANQIDVTVAGVAYSFPGQLGLAPQWGLTGGTCDTSCQEWVSACVIARLDYLGEDVSISLRGKTAALASTPSEISAYTVAEGAYYGNIFLDTPVMYGCVAPGRTGLPRVCGPTTAGCIVEDLGSCAQACDKADKKDGSFPSCSNENSSASQGNFSFHGRTYAASATVFLLP